MKHLNNSRQHGATMWTTLSFVLMIGFIAFLAFKLSQAYLDHGIVRGSMQEIANHHEFQRMTAKQIAESIKKRLIIDSIRDFDKDAFKVVREKSGEKYILIDYSKTVHIAGNVSALVEFKEEIRPERK
ncbi:DUF4845 domain-containing protein [Aliikangiella sp. G2MR2-5]|uniref:DUF4845 domain-containing protein n=1 Tax=Aliikangiella sp. G2MR2-5 TaxID=2788943 RepID=UPI0018AA2D79|nr:DUF4845 domain-containing protein [Aliikangiella sp. G2MR2-5]